MSNAKASTDGPQHNEVNILKISSLKTNCIKHSQSAEKPCWNDAIGNQKSGQQYRWSNETRSWKWFPLHAVRNFTSRSSFDRGRKLNLNSQRPKPIWQQKLQWRHTHERDHIESRATVLCSNADVSTNTDEISRHFLFTVNNKLLLSFINIIIRKVEVI